MKKIIALLISIVMLTSVVNAYKFPNAFWPINDRYAAALETGDYEGIINAGKEALALFEGVEENQEILNVRSSRTEQIAIAYEMLGNFNESAIWFKKYNEYAKKLGWDDAVKISAAKAMQYETDVRLYKDSNSTVSYYGAKLEPQKGVYYGVTADSNSGIADTNAVLLYCEFGESNTGWMEKILCEAKAAGKAVEFAWNFPAEGATVPTVMQSRDYIISILTMLEKYNSIPIFIRLGAEMNVWTNRAEPEQYKSTFRFVADLARQYTTNTAMVWSVNSVSSWDIEMNDYYPGDEYVDWIGVSLYLKKYFMGRNNLAENERFNEVVFQTGDSADPVKSLTEIVEKFGNRKPIMIAESGVSHTTRTCGDYDTAWAKRYIAELYANVPMVLPQVKLIAYFDKVMAGETYDYALSSNSEMLNAYKKLVTLPHFAVSDSAVTYEQISNNSEVSTDDCLYTYAHIYGADDVKVHYYIDDKWASVTDEVPYKFAGLASYPEGNHKVTVAIEANGIRVFEESYNINLKNEIKISIDGNLVTTDVAPMLVNDRTMVPVRVVAEGLKANVEWEEATEKIYITKNGRKITLQIGNNVINTPEKDIKIDVEPMIFNGRTLVPIRAVSEMLNADVQWSGVDNTVYITSK